MAEHGETCRAWEKNLTKRGVIAGRLGHHFLSRVVNKAKYAWLALADCYNVTSTNKNYPMKEVLMKAIVFDVFGTVVDWRTSLIHQFAALGKELEKELVFELPVLWA